MSPIVPIAAFLLLQRRDQQRRGDDSEQPPYDATREQAAHAAAVDAGRGARESGASDEAQAAAALRDYLERGGAVRAKVRELQRRMGLTATSQTGLVGPLTRGRAKELGVTLPPQDSINAAVRVRES